VTFFTGWINTFRQVRQATAVMVPGADP